jgi:hypothetical protein
VCVCVCVCVRARVCVPARTCHMSFSRALVCSGAAMLACHPSCVRIAIIPPLCALTSSRLLQTCSFILLSCSLQPPSEKDNDDLASAFRVFDRGGTGAIPAEEFVNQAKILGNGLNDFEAEELLKLAHDGKLNYKGENSTPANCLL